MRPGLCVVTAVSSLLDGAVSAGSVSLLWPRGLDSGCRSGLRHLKVLGTSSGVGGVSVETA